MAGDSLNDHVALLADDYLVSSGWRRSIDEGQSMDGEGVAPWFTYAATRYLAGIVRPEYRVLEYGAGNSTLWWAERVAEVVTVEHDPVWAAYVRDRQLPNVRVFERHMGDGIAAEYSQVFLKEFLPLDIGAVVALDPTRNYRAGLIDCAFHSYASVLLDYPQGYFDVVVVDGMARVLTAWLAARQVSREGVIVFDNSDRAEYQAAYDYLDSIGFCRIDFHGLGPINPYGWSTSLFVRSLNPLRKIL